MNSAEWAKPVRSRGHPCQRLWELDVNTKAAASVSRNSKPVNFLPKNCLSDRQDWNSSADWIRIVTA